MKHEMIQITVVDLEKTISEIEQILFFAKPLTLFKACLFQLVLLTTFESTLYDFARFVLYIVSRLI